MGVALFPNSSTLKLVQVLHFVSAAALLLVSAGESPRNETLDIAELAAYQMVASLILNLDQTITRD